MSVSSQFAALCLTDSYVSDMLQRKGLFLPFAFVMASSGQQTLDAHRSSKRKAGMAAEQTTYSDTFEFIEATSEGLSCSIFQVPFVPDPVAKEEYERRKQREIELAEREQIEAEAGEKDQTEKKRTQASVKLYIFVIDLNNIVYRTDSFLMNIGGMRTYSQHATWL